MKFISSLLLFAPLAALAAPMVNESPFYSSSNAQVIPGQYLVVMKDHVSTDDFLAHHVWLNSVVPQSTESAFDILVATDDVHRPHKKAGHGFHTAFEIAEDNLRGYVATLSDEQVGLIRNVPEVAYVEQDQIVNAYDIEQDAPWGLGRVSHRSHPDDLNMHKFLYDHEAGNGVTAYVVDTGINIKHVDFEGRASWGKTIPEGDADEDGNGHGTHVSGTMVGKKYGVAKSAKVVAVKVLRSNGSGSMSDVVKGIEWVANDHKRRQKEAKTNKKGEEEAVLSVANMSLGGGRSRVLDATVNAAVASGVHFAVAAGNDNRDACNYSPAAANKAITVGATTVQDSRAWFSNWGKCVDIFAPGHQILSAWIGSEVATNTISGTSMASPHIAGVVTGLLSRPDWAKLSPASLKAKLIQTGVKNIVRMGFLPPGHHTRNLFVFSDPHVNDEGDDDGPLKVQPFDDE